MKTKLELYLATQAAAEASLTKPAKSAQTVIDELVKPLAPEDRDFAVQLFWSRRQRMTELSAQPINLLTSKNPKL